MQKCKTRSFIDATTLGFDDAVLDLVTHADSVTTTNCINSMNKIYLSSEALPINTDWVSLMKSN